MLKLVLLRLFVAVVSHVSSVGSLAIADRALLIVAVEILDVQGATSLVVSELSIGSWLKSLILGSCSSLSVEMLTQVTIWRF